MLLTIRMTHHCLGVFGDVLHHVVHAAPEPFLQLVPPLCLSEILPEQDVREKIDEHRRYRQFLVGQLDFNTHGLRHHPNLGAKRLVEW